MARYSTTTQTTFPWRTTVRTVVQAVIMLAALAPFVYEAIAQQDAALATGGAAIALAVATAVTRVMALPAVDEFLARFIPWLAAEPRDA